MSRIKNALLLSSCLLSISLYGVAAAENQASTDETSEWTFKLGAGVMANSQAWKGVDTEGAVDGYFEANIGNWYFNFENPVVYKTDVNTWSSVYLGIGLRSDIYENPNFAINDVPESAIFKGYEDPDLETIINYGATLGWVSIDASTDVSNNSESDTLALTLEIPVYEGSTGFSISTSLSANWMDSNYVNYYYGISGSQIDNSVGRTKYEASSATNYGIAIEAMYPINDQWVVVGGLSHTVLADEISDSPLIDSDFQDEAMLMVIYQF
jgi:outer membrane protein